MGRLMASPFAYSLDIARISEDSTRCAGRELSTYSKTTVRRSERRGTASGGLNLPSPVPLGDRRGTLRFVSPDGRIQAGDDAVDYLAQAVLELVGIDNVLAG